MRKSGFYCVLLSGIATLALAQDTSCPCVSFLPPPTSTSTITTTVLQTCPATITITNTVTSLPTGFNPADVVFVTNTETVTVSSTDVSVESVLVTEIDLIRDGGQMTEVVDVNVKWVTRTVTATATQAVSCEVGGGEGQGEAGGEVPGKGDAERKGDGEGKGEESGYGAVVEDCGCEKD